MVCRNSLPLILRNERILIRTFLFKPVADATRAERFCNDDTIFGYVVSGDVLVIQLDAIAFFNISD